MRVNSIVEGTMSPVFEGLESGKTPREGSEQFEQFGTAVTTAAIAIVVSKSGDFGRGVPLCFKGRREVFATTDLVTYPDSQDHS